MRTLKVPALLFTSWLLVTSGCGSDSGNTGTGGKGGAGGKGGSGGSAGTAVGRVAPAAAAAVAAVAAPAGDAAPAAARRRFGRGGWIEWRSDCGSRRRDGRSGGSGGLCRHRRQRRRRGRRWRDGRQRWTWRRRRDGRRRRRGGGAGARAGQAARRVVAVRPPARAARRGQRRPDGRRWRRRGSGRHWRALDPPLPAGNIWSTSVLGCPGCHTPQGGASLSGTDCFAKSGTTGCLSSANLTNDPWGLMNLTDQQIKDAFTKGIDPARRRRKYLFANMPYYQFATLDRQDANAIVAYLRTRPRVSHTVQASTAPFDVRPTAPSGRRSTRRRSPGGRRGGPGERQVPGDARLRDLPHRQRDRHAAHIDAAKAFQGGRCDRRPSAAPRRWSDMNLTPDATGLMSWNVSQIAAAITTAKARTARDLRDARAREHDRQRRDRHRQLPARRSPRWRTRSR